MKKILIFISIITIIFLFGCDFFNNAKTTNNIQTTSNIASTKEITTTQTTTQTTIQTTEQITTEQLYQVNFDSMGGLQLDPIYTTYGSGISLPIPRKEGYIFLGWFTGEEGNGIQFTELSTVNGDLTLYAQWEINQYTISFDSNEGTDIASISQDFGTIVTPPQDPTKEGYSFLGWYKDIELTEEYIFTTMPAENVTLYAKWSINQYTISFNSDGGSVISSITQVYGSTVTEPTDSIKIGYTFGGWYADSELTQEYTFSTMPAEDVTLYAKWDIETYDITYNLDGGTNGSNPATYTIETSSFVFANPTKEGYTFNGWFDNAEHTGDAVANIQLGTTGDINLYASWDVNQYSITYLIYDISDLANDILLNPGETIISNSLGYNDSALVTSEGRVFIWGLNSAGELGDGTKTNRLSPVDITSQFDLGAGEKVVSISLGYMFSAAITSEGRLFMWGQGYYGQLGIGNSSDLLTPYDITPQFHLNDGVSIIAVELGRNHALALSSEKRVYAWGDNQYGQCGFGEAYNSYVPLDITDYFNLEPGEQIISLATGSNHSAAITTNGSIFMWGENGNGKIGDGTSDNRWVPTDITSGFHLNPDELVTEVSLGSYHSAALTSDGRLFTWGYNQYGQLGITTEEDYVYTPMDITSQFNLGLNEQLISIDLGDLHSSVMSSDGSVFTWGYNQYGQLGYESTTYFVYNPANITNNFDLNDNEVIVFINLGSDHSSAITSEGRVFTWGYNGAGQLGDGTTSVSPIAIPEMVRILSVYSHTVSIFDFNDSISHYIPTRDGYTFDAWYIDSELTLEYTFGTMPAEDIILYGRWIPN